MVNTERLDGLVMCSPTHTHGEIITQAASKDPAIKKRIFEVANRIINAGKLENYGTKKAQGFLKKWAKEFGDEKRESKKRDKD